MLLPPPPVFSLPPKFTEWRKGQEQVILQATDSPERVVVQVAATGTGKSLSYIAAAILTGRRTVILTSTKGLQDQLMADFSTVGLVDIKGRGNYTCNLEHDGTRCDSAPCIMGYHCPLRESGCSYFDQVALATRAPLVVTNYSYWLSAHQHGDGLGDVGMLVCDEAHDAPEIVAEFLTVTLDLTDPVTREYLPKDGTLSQLTHSGWSQWARVAVKSVVTEMERLKSGEGGKTQRRQYAKLRNFRQSLLTISGIDPSNWVIQSDRDTTVFAPLWPSTHCERVLFLGIPHILLTSATVCEKSVGMLGVTADYNYREYPHPFPVSHRRLYHIPTVRMNHTTDQYGMKLWLTRIDQILKARLDRKGIIHTVSYQRRDLVMSTSPYSQYMVTHKRQNTVETVKRFKEMPPPAYLVSPTMDTGWDFPASQCEFQIIGKLAYPDTRAAVAQARVKSDKEYSPYVAMQRLIQTVGRGVRTPTDRCENFCIDDNILWFLPRYRHLAPKWFLESFARATTIPVAPAPMYQP